MKRAIAVILSIVFMLLAFGGVVSAQTDDMTAIGLENNLYDLKPKKPTGGFLPGELIRLDEVKESRGTKGILRSSVSDETTIYEYLKNSMKDRVGKIELYPKYKIQAPYIDGKHNIREFHNILRTVLFDNYDIFVYDNPNNCTVKTVGGITYINDFSPDYYTPAEGDEYAKINMLNAIDVYIDAVSDIPSDDVVGKMLVIHDLFCANNMYDSEGLYNEEHNGISCNYARTAYYMLTQNMGVCQGYAIALKAIYDKLNYELMQETGVAENIIETSLCSSDLVEHIWNVVKIDRQWYHLDATWDDVDYDYEYVYDEEGNYVLDEKGNPMTTPIPIECAAHDFFLKTDSFFMEDDEYRSAHVHFDADLQPIYDWVFYTDEQVICDNDKYSQGYIFNIDYAYLISYSDGGYNIDLGFPLRSNSIILTEILATDPYVEEGSNVNNIILFTMQPVDIVRISTAFDETGALMANKCRINESVTIGTIYNFTMLQYNNNITTKLFIWSPDTFEPLCRAIDLPAVVQ